MKFDPPLLWVTPPKLAGAQTVWVADPTMQPSNGLSTYRRRASGGADPPVIRLMKLLDSGIDAFLARFGNPTRVLKEQLDAQGVSVWLSSGCMKEFAGLAHVAATHARQADESYGSCLRREMATRTRFIREWTGSDRKFDPSEWGELMAIAQKYALPRPWRVTEPRASMREQANLAHIPPQQPMKIVGR